MWGVAALTILLVLAAAPRAARADAIAPRPLECPPGSVHDVSHRGDACVATTCATDTDCERHASRGREGTWSCREASLCVEAMVGDQSWHGPSTQSLARRECVTADHCVRPEVCERAKRCVLTREVAAAAPPPPGEAVTSGGCACEAGASSPREAGPWLATAAFAFSLAAAGWRRSRRLTS